MTTDNVTKLPSASETPENLLRPESSAKLYFCQHQALTIDVHTRTVKCAEPKCGAIVDPFNYLLSEATHLQSAWNNYRHLKGLVGELNDRVDLLKKEEKRLRGIVKRLQEKSGTLTVTRGNA